MVPEISPSQSSFHREQVLEKCPSIPPELYSALMAAEIMSFSHSGGRGAQSELVPEKRPPMPPEKYSELVASDMSPSQSVAQSDLVPEKHPPMPPEKYSKLVAARMPSFQSGAQSDLGPEKRPPMPPELHSTPTAAQMPSSQSGTQSDVVPEERLPMPPNLYSVLMSGEEYDIIEYLGLSDERQVEVQVQVEALDPTDLQRMETKSETNRSDIIKCAAVQSGDTVLHLLIHNGYDDLAVRVFRKEPSLVKSQNNNLETPLHIAARTGRKNIVCELIKINSGIVKDALAKENCNGNTALHIAARHRNAGIGRELMKLDPKVAEMVNHEQSAPIHVAVRNGNKKLVEHIMEEFPENAKLLDSHKRNLFHIAALENQADLFDLPQIRAAELLYLPSYGNNHNIAAIAREMNSATDCDGNTPLHIAATMGHRLTMSVIYENKLSRVAEKMPNREGYTPFELSVKQVEKNSKIKDIKVRISSYIYNNNDKFTSRWFDDIMAPSYESKWERTQVIGLGAVLITTITFAAAFTIPGGYDQNDGTPILGRTVAYKAFTIANTLSFILAFTSLYTLVSRALVDPDYAHLKDATNTFTASAKFMVLAFGLGSYVILVPVSFPIAIITLILTIPLGSPYMSPTVTFYRSMLEYIYKSTKWMLQNKAMAIGICLGLCFCALVILAILFSTFAIFVGLLKLAFR